MVPTLELFGADAQVGYGSRHLPDFPSCADLVAHLDRLGVARSLVWSTEARDRHVAGGNRGLLDELDRIDRRQERLVPSLVIAPVMQYSADTMRETDELRANGIHHGDLDARPVECPRVSPGRICRRMTSVEHHRSGPWNPPRLPVPRTDE